MSYGFGAVRGPDGGGCGDTDVWEAVKGRVARLLGRGDARKTEVAEQWLEQTNQQLTTAASSGLEQAREAQAERWAGRFADLLDEDPGVAPELRALVEESRPATRYGSIGDFVLTRSSCATCTGLISCSYIATAASRNRSRRARPAAGQATTIGISHRSWPRTVRPSKVTQARRL